MRLCTTHVHSERNMLTDTHKTTCPNACTCICADKHTDTHTGRHAYSEKHTVRYATHPRIDMPRCIHTHTHTLTELY